MAVEDTKAAFLHVPWISRLIDHPNVTCNVSNSRSLKADLEDSLYAETFKTSRTVQSCIYAYRNPDDGIEHLDEVLIFHAIGDGMNGFPGVLHGGISSTILDESMGIFQSAGAIFTHSQRIKRGAADANLPPKGVITFTGELKIRFLRQVRAPGYLVVVVKQVKEEGRKRWLSAELKQCHSDQADGELVTCVTAESLWIQPRTNKI